MLQATSILLRLLNVLNWVVGIAFAGMVAVSFAAEAAFLAELAPRFGARSGALLTDLRLAFAIGIPVIPAASIIFTRLLAILASVRAGDAFVAANGGRLRTIAWALLVIQIADLGFGFVAVRFTENSGEYFGWSPSIVGWLAVLLLFVLAQVWTQGAAMRDELEGTV